MQGLCLCVPGCATGQFTVDTARSAAVGGNARALYFLARHYFKGDGVPQDRKQAAQFMCEAAEKGYTRAENDYGAYCLQGWGMKPNPIEAVAWFQKAATKGDPLAAYSLGMCYERGLGVSMDMVQALRWYRQAALKNQREAAAALDRIYLSGGPGIPRNYDEAFRWAKLGGKLDDAGCLNDLGFMYERGLGTRKNAEKAAKCYLAAAQKGYARAFANLGQLYLDGLQLKLNLVTAYKWFLIGVSHGDGISRHYLEEMNLKKLLTDAQKSEAETQARNYEAALQKQRA